MFGYLLQLVLEATVKQPFFCQYLCILVSLQVVLRYKLGFSSCQHRDTWDCLSGKCGNQSSLVVKTISEKKGEWCHSEGIMTRLVPSNALFQLG